MPRWCHLFGRYKKVIIVLRLQLFVSSELCHDLSSGATTDEPGLNGTEFGVEKTNSYLCPRGYYCQKGVELVSCPNGTYNDKLGAGHKDQCDACPDNHYNPWEAQTSCLSCSPLTSREGSDTCVCNGKNQIYQVHRNRTI